MIWIMRHPRATPEMLGYIPQFLSENDPRPAREQLDDNYRQGGGWEPLSGFKITEEGLKYPGDPPMALLAETKLRDEVIRFYDCSWVVIIQPDGSFEASRMD
jgi:hypothetical protein